MSESAFDGLRSGGAANWVLSPKIVGDVGPISGNNGATDVCVRLTGRVDCLQPALTIYSVWSVSDWRCFRGCAISSSSLERKGA